MMHRILVMLSTLLGLPAWSAVAQDSDHAAEAQQRLDYLIGSWDVISDILDADGNVTQTRRSFDVGAAGDVYVLSGSMAEYVMTTQPRSTRRGGSIMYRFTHTNIHPHSFEATMETSADGGRTWIAANRHQRLVRRRPR